jgi:alanyl-tRNA synthetase
MMQEKILCENHSATHLLHKGLKNTLGSHVEQKGSLVDESKTRFDFSHPKALTSDEIKSVEMFVNQENTQQYRYGSQNHASR